MRPFKNRSLDAQELGWDVLSTMPGAKAPAGSDTPSVAESIHDRWSTIGALEDARQAILDENGLVEPIESRLLGPNVRDLARQESANQQSAQVAPPDDYAVSRSDSTIVGVQAAPKRADPNREIEHQWADPDRGLFRAMRPTAIFRDSTDS
jgi:hypothetical protein